MSKPRHHQAAKAKPPEQLAPEYIEQELNLGIKHYQSGKLPEAEACYQQVLQWQPNNADAWHLLGLIASQQAQYQTAIERIERAMRLNSTNPIFYNNLGNIYQRQGNLQGAIELYQKAIQLQPNYADAYNNLGNTYQEQGQWTKAIDCYQQAIQLQPHLANVYGNLGVAYQKQGQWTEAIDCYHQAIQLQPNHAVAYKNLGGVYQQQGQWTEAIDCYQQAIQLQPNYADAHYNLGVIYQKQGQWTEAIDCYQQAIQLQPNYADAHYNLGVIYQKQGQWTEAIECYQQAIQLQPNFPNAYNNLGNTYYQQGQLAEAIDCYQQAIQLQPNFPNAHYNLGVTYQEQGQLAEAIDCYQQAIQLQLNYAAAYNNLGNAYYQQGQLAEAIDCYQQAIQLQPNYANAHYNLGVTYQKQGQWTEAIDCYQQAIQLQPNYANAHYNLGVTYQKQGQWTEAINCYQQAIQLQPNYALAYKNLGGVYQQQERLTEAIDCYQQAIQLQPNFPNAHYNLGITYQEQGQWTEAIDCYQQAIQLQPNFANAYYNLGVTYQKQGQLMEAIDCYQQAIQLQPDYATAYNNLGNAYYQQGQLMEAVDCYQQAIQLQPNFANAYYNLGVIYQEQKQWTEAVDCYQQAIQLQLNYAAAYNNLGNTYYQQGKLSEAIDCYQQAIQLQPNYADAHYNLGVTYQEQGKLSEAVDCYHQAIQLQPNYAAAYNNLGNTYYDQGQLTEAIDCYYQAIQFKPDNAIAHRNLGMSLLLLGDFERGFRQYEFRLEDKNLNYLKSKIPIWDGSNIEGKSIVLLKEQGLGDTIQFLRYGKKLREQGARVILSIQPPLVSLFQECLEDQFEFIEKSDCDIYAYDYHAFLMSLPGIFRTTLDNIPNSTPYIFPPNPLRSNCILPSSSSYRIGIVWASQINTPTHHKKSCNPELFMDLLKVGNVSLYSLQVGEDASKIGAWLENERVHNLSPLLKDFVDTASVIYQLDLVITVDTAVAHLAGAMGKPVWVLLPFMPDWRWLLERQDTPWYPTMRLFRQPSRGDWASVFEQVKGKLKEVLEGESPIFPVETVETVKPESQVNFGTKHIYIHLISYFQGYAGYNVHAREFTKALEEVIPSEKATVIKSNYSDEKELEARQKMLLEFQDTASIINICISYGSQCWEKLRLFPGLKIAYTVWESTKLPDDWIEPLTRCDYVWTASRWGKEVFIQNGLNPERVFVIPEGVDPQIFNPHQKTYDGFSKIKGFKFFTVGKCEPRKSTRELIIAFDLEFHHDPDVFMVLACHNPFISKFKIQTFVQNLWLRNYNKFLYVSRAGTHEQIAQIMAACNCGVFPTKAEGWGLPILESMALGKPTIVTDYSGVTEYANQSNAILLDYYPLPIQDTDGIFFLRADGDYGTWALPNTTTLRKKMREVYENYRHYQQQFLSASAEVRANWSWQASAQKAWQLMANLADFDKTV